MAIKGSAENGDKIKAAVGQADFAAVLQTLNPSVYPSSVTAEQSDVVESKGTAPSSSDSSKSGNGGMIAGIVIAVVVVGAAIGFYVTRQKSSDGKAPNTVFTAMENPVHEPEFTEATDMNTNTVLSNPSYEVAPAMEEANRDSNYDNAAYLQTVGGDDVSEYDA